MTWITIRLLILFFPCLLISKQKICLNMIVKNESAVIRRCLDSVMPIIDYWVIVDTGSTDDTKKIIKRHLKDIPGELHERRWKNFGANRTEAFQLAKGKGDYILFMDADDVLEFETDIQLPTLTKDLYNLWRGTNYFTYLKPQFVKADLPWKWVGVTHEYLDCDVPYTTSILEKVKYISKDDGASRSYDSNKFLKNIKLLQEGLIQEPNNSRYVFYLAESYRDSHQKGNALEWYQKRVVMGGWEEEIYWSKLQIGLLLHEMGLPLNIVAACYKDAHDVRPHRPEAVYYLADVYNQQKKYDQAYACIKEWMSAHGQKSKDALFNIDWIADYGLFFQLSLCSYYLGHYKESLDLCEKLLTNQNMPESWRDRVALNRKYPLSMLEAAKPKQSEGSGI